MSRVVDWLELSNHLLPLIANKLINIKDYIRFGLVCKTWRSIYIEEARHHLALRQVPLFMLSTEHNNDDQTRSFYDITEKRICNSQVEVPHNMYCAGSSYGWLITICKDYEISLLNPFLSLNSKIHLPSLSTFEVRDFDDEIHEVDHVQKVVLSANPVLNPSYFAMAIQGGFSRLQFCKPGDRGWTGLDTRYRLIFDVIFYKDQFYFVNDTGAVFACDLNHPHHPIVSLVALPPNSFGSNSMEGRYIVESSGDLLLIRRLRGFIDEDEYSDSHDYITQGFIVFKLDPVEVKWIEVKNVGGHVLFLGWNSSLSLPASYFPGCKPNHIYFTDDYFDGNFERDKTGVGPHDNGIFNLEDGSLEPHYILEPDVIIPSPIWIEPTLQLCWN